MAVFRGRGARAVLPVFCALGILCLCGLLAPPTLQAQSLPLYAVHHFDQQLETIDPLTGATLTSQTILLEGQSVQGSWGLDRHPTTGQLYALLQLSGQVGRELVSIDPGTGIATDIGNTGHKLGAITFRRDSLGAVTLYGVAGNSDPTDPDTLFTLDLSTGAPTFVPAFGNGNMGETIAFNPVDGLIYRAYGSGDPNVDQFLVSVDPVTLAVTDIPLSGDFYNQATALTHWAGNFFLMADHDQNLYVVSTSGQVRLLSFLETGVGDTKGLVFTGIPPVCPPPAGTLFTVVNNKQFSSPPSVLYTLDPVSAALTLIGPIGFDSVSAIKFSQSGVLFGTGHEPGTNTSALLTIDLCTGAGTEVGPTNINSINDGEDNLGYFADLAFRKADGTLFAFATNQAFSHEAAGFANLTGLLTLDTATAQAALVGFTRVFGLRRFKNGLAFSPSGILFHADIANLNTLDQTTGEPTLVAPLSIDLGPFNTTVNGMDFQPSTGILFALVSRIDSDFLVTDSYLNTIDTTTGEATLVTAGTVMSDGQVPGGLAFLPSPQAGVPATITTGGGSGSQSTPINTAFPLPLQAVVKDSGGNGVPGVAVTFTVPSSGPSATFPGGVLSVQVTTDTTGTATSPTLTANGTVGSYLGTGTVADGCTPESPRTASVTVGSYRANGTGTGPLTANYSLTNTLSTGATISTGGNGSGSQSTMIHTPFPLPLQATVKDSGGTPVPGVTVTFTAPSSGPSGTFPGDVLSVQGTTDASGVATSPTLTANGTVGSYLATGTVSGIATPANYSLTNTLSVGATISTGGNGSGSQSTMIHTAFALPLQATVKDSGGTPVPGVMVTFTVPSSGPSATFPGGVPSVQVVTDASGAATAPTLTANGTVGGPYTATGTVTGIATPANYLLTNTLSAGATISTGGNGSGSQRTMIHTPFPLPLQATVKDSGGTPVPGVTVIFTLPSSGASATFPGGVLSVQVVTDASGVATSPTLTANGTVGGPYTATGTVTGIATPANYSLTNTPGPASSVTANGGSGQRTAVTTAFALPLQVTVRDSDGNLVPGVTVTFTPPGSGASSAFAGGVNTAVTNASGVAPSATFTANSTSGSYTVNATVPGVESSTPFALTNVDFSVASATGTQAVAAGGTANYSLNFTAIADKSVNPTTFACLNLPANSACAFNPPSLPADSGNTPFGLAISTTARPTTAASVGSGGGFGLPLGVLPGVVLALLAMIAMSLASFSKREPRFAPSRVATFGLLVLMVGHIAGCGAVGTGFPAGSGGGVQGTPAGTYTVTVVATSGTLQRTTTVSLTVQ